MLNISLKGNNLEILMSNTDLLQNLDYLRIKAKIQQS